MGTANVVHNCAKLKAASAILRPPPLKPSPSPGRPARSRKDDPASQAIASGREGTGRAAGPLAEGGTPPAASPTGRGEKRTLTNLYNARPTWLDLAHKRLDEAVFAAYGWKSDLSDEEILEKLLALNLERSK